MRLLAVDTATEACSAALWLDGRVIEQFELAGRSHTQRMLPMIRGLMAEAGLGFEQLDGLVCGTGPGSFAGVRIAVGYIKGLGLALDRPVIGVGSLAMLAQGAIDSGAQRVACAIDARMNEVYFGAFERDPDGLPTPVGAQRVLPPERVEFHRPGVWTGVGTGWGTYEAQLRKAVQVAIDRIDGAALPRASQALKMAAPSFGTGAWASADTLAPVYLRDRVALTLDEQSQLRQRKTTRSE